MKKRKVIYTLNLKRISMNILIILSIFLVFGIISSVGYGKREVNTYEVQVTGYDTIWNLAESVCKKAPDQNLNVQNIVIQIKNLNDLETSDIYEGQTLKIPDYSPVTSSQLAMI